MIRGKSQPSEGIFFNPVEQGFFKEDIRREMLFTISFFCILSYFLKVLNWEKH